jgi:hypothetical protein
LQTHGYLLEQDLPTSKPILKQVYVNLNVAQFVTRQWEMVYHILGEQVFAHLYREFIVFLKTRDHSLVQISGTNVFNYLSDRFVQKPKDQEPSTILGAPAANPESGEAQFSEKQKADAKSHKFRLKNDKDMYQLNLPKSQWDECVNRNRLFYCAH